MVNVGLMLVGFIVIALGILIGLYFTLERRRGHIQYGTLTIKSNLTTNTPYIMTALGIALIGAGWILP